MSGPIRYEIIDGVRRAKAFQLHGLTSIRARVDGTNLEMDVDIDSLGSPHKVEIDTTTAAGRKRWTRIVALVGAGQWDVLPPIVVRVGQRPPRIQDVNVV